MELEPERALSHYKLGVALFHTGALDEAARSFETAVTLDPELHIARYSLGTVYAKMGRVDLATETLEAYRKLAPPLDPQQHDAETMLIELRKKRGGAVVPPESP